MEAMAGSNILQEILPHHSITLRIGIDNQAAHIMCWEWRIAHMAHAATKNACGMNDDAVAISFKFFVKVSQALARHSYLTMPRLTFLVLLASFSECSTKGKLLWPGIKCGDAKPSAQEFLHLHSFLRTAS